MRRSRIAIALLVGLALAVCAVVLAAGAFLTRPAPADTGAPPAELEARSLRFFSRTGATLEAWFAPGVRGRGAVLLLHAIRGNKATMAARAQFLKRDGYAVLLLDLQAHGGSSGDTITFGHREAADVEAAVARLRELAPGERVGVLGVSLGAAAALLADVQPPFDAVVVESLYPTIGEAIADRLRLHLGSAGPWLAPLLVWQLEPRLGVPPSRLRPIDRVAGLGAALLVVHGAQDRHTTLAEAERLYAAAVEPKELYVLSGAGHVDLHAHGGARYEARIGRFLARHLRGG